MSHQMQNKLKHIIAAALCLCALFCIGCKNFGPGFGDSALFQKQGDSSEIQRNEPSPVPYTATMLRPPPEPVDELNWFERMIGVEEDPPPPETIRDWMGQEPVGMGGSMR
jgi:hypothetical protein